MKRHPAPPFLARQVLGLLAPIVFTGPAFANKALAEKHGYLGCHAAATKLVGPALREIAARYAGDANAAAALVQSI